MDCVGCDKCRLWGKIQTTGVATALKILFELDEKALDPAANHNLLQRSEVVALINTLHRFSESLEAVEGFREMWKATSTAEGEKLIVEAERLAAATSRVRRTNREVPAHADCLLLCFSRDRHPLLDESKTRNGWMWCLRGGSGCARRARLDAWAWWWKCGSGDCVR